MALAVSGGASTNSTAPGTPVQPTAAPVGMATPAAGTSAHRQVPLTCHGHTRPVVSVQFSTLGEDGNYFLLSACKDGNPMLRDGPTGDWLGTFQGHKGAVWSARLNSDASRAATGSADFTAKVWDAYTGDELLSLPHGHIVRATDLNRAGTLLATGGNEKILRVFDIGAMTEAPVANLTGHTGNIKNIAWDDARNVLLSTGDDGEIRIWDLRAKAQVRSCQVGGPIVSMDLSADGSFVTCTSGKSAQFWNADRYELVKSYTMAYDVSSVSLHPSKAKFVAGGSNDLWVRIYDFESGAELELYKGHHGPIHTVAYSPDGEIYATGSEDGTIRLWQTVAGKTYGLWAEKPKKHDTDKDASSSSSAAGPTADVQHAPAESSPPGVGGLASGGAE